MFKGLSYILGCKPSSPVLRKNTKTVVVMASIEIVGKVALGNGLAAAIRPKKYYTIPREALEASLEDVEQLINFFVIEFQRILFAENVTASSAAFLAAFISYWLIKFTPLWVCTLQSHSTYLTVTGTNDMFS